MTVRHQNSGSVRSSQIHTLYMGLDLTQSSLFCVYMLLLQYAADILKYYIPCILLLLITFS